MESRSGCRVCDAAERASEERCGFHLPVDTLIGAHILEWMAQLTIYLDEKTRRRIEKEARRADLSVSEWVRGKLTEALDEGWPAGYFDILGSVRDKDLARPPEIAPSRDARRTRL